MATYYVDGQNGRDTNNGSTSQPWKTIGKAVGSVKPGDEVLVRTAVYHESFKLTTPNTKWMADSGHTPVIDGRYHEGLFDSNGNLPTPQPGMGVLPENWLGNLISLAANGVTFDGFTVRNVAGTGIGVGNSNCTVRNCRLDFIYSSGIRINAGSQYADNVIIENNVLTRVSVRYYDPDRTGGGPAMVGGIITSVQSRDSVIRNNVLAFGHGEGINGGRGSLRLTIEGNIVHTCNHIHIYINRSRDTIIRNNLVYHLYLKGFIDSNGYPPDGIVIGDESSFIHPHSTGGQIYNNIVIGLTDLLDVRNNQNYNTQLKDCYIGYNTFIGTDKTSRAIRIAQNVQGRPHENALIENNIFFNAPTMGLAIGDISAVAFRNNLWEKQPPQVMRGAGDRIGNPNLKNPLTNIIGNFPKPDSNIDLSNYQLTTRSNLAVGMASDGSTINNITPPVIRKDFFGANRDNIPDIGAHEYVGVSAEITANFSVGPGQEEGKTPHTVDFTDKSTSTRPIVSWFWDFGDGETSTETNPSHTFQKTGSFDVSLVVTDDQGKSNTLIRAAFVNVNQSPTTEVPNTFRRFILRNSTDQIIHAYGSQYPDLHCIVVWNSEPFHILNYVGIEEVQFDNQATDYELVWLDGENDEEQIEGMIDYERERFFS